MITGSEFLRKVANDMEVSFQQSLMARVREVLDGDEESLKNEFIDNGFIQVSVQDVFEIFRKSCLSHGISTEIMLEMIDSVLNKISDSLEKSEWNLTNDCATGVKPWHLVPYFHVENVKI